MNNAIIWQVTIVIVVFILILGIGLSVTSGRKKNRKERMVSVISGGRSSTGNQGNDPRQMARSRAELSRKLKEAGAEEDNKNKDKVSIRQLIQRAGFDTSVSRFWIYSVIFTAIVCGLLMLTGVGSVSKGFIIFTAFLGMPRFFLKFKAKRRQKKFLKEFADALEAMTRLLQAGMPVSEAIAMVSREYDGPLGDEMVRIYEDQKVGITLGEAAVRASQRMPLTEVKMFATAVQIQAETGSSLSEVLNNLAAVIRARFRLQRKVKALSSEAKASASIIGCLPILVACGLYAVNPDYISLLFTEPQGKVMTVGAVMWMSLGILVMKQMINFKI